MRRTNRDFKDRTVSRSVTREMGDAYGYSMEELADLVEEKARELENSINGVVAVANNDHVVNIRIICGKNANVDLIKYISSHIESEVMREMHD